MVLTVRDDGAGHPAPGACASGPVPDGPVTHRSSAGIGSGSGLHGIAERISAVGGSLEIRPDTAPGFCLVAAVPTGRQAVHSENLVTQAETVNDIVNS